MVVGVTGWCQLCSREISLSLEISDAIKKVSSVETVCTMMLLVMLDMMLLVLLDMKPILQIGSKKFETTTVLRGISDFARCHFDLMAGKLRWLYFWMEINV